MFDTLCNTIECGVYLLPGLIPVELIDDDNQNLNKEMEEKGLLKNQVNVCVNHVLCMFILNVILRVCQGNFGL